MSLAQLAPLLSKPLSLGARGPEVKFLQSALNTWNDGGKTILVDGRFGKATHQAVLVVQSYEKLKQDGVVGPKTAEALGLFFRSRGAEMPIIIRFEEPPRPPMTPPLELLVAVIADGIKPLRDAIEDAILLAPGGNPRLQLQHRDQANEGYDDLIEDLESWSKDLPSGNLAVAKLRAAFQDYITWIHSELKATQFQVRGGWIWRYHPVLDKLPVDSIAGIADRILRGEQTPVVAIAQLRMTFEQFNRMLALVPRMDDNGVGPGGKPSLT